MEFKKRIEDSPMSGFYKQPGELLKLMGNQQHGKISIENINKLASEELKCPADPPKKIDAKNII